MNMQTRIQPGSDQDVNLTRIFLRHDIVCVKRWLVGKFAVELLDGSFGVGDSVGEALDKALAPNAENIRKVAA